MLLLVEICAALAGLAVVAIAVAAFRALRCIEKATAEMLALAAEGRQWITEAREVTREARVAVTSVHAAVAPLGRIAERLEAVGGRAAALSSAAIDAVGPLFRTVLTLTRGVRLGSDFLVKQFDHRFTNGRHATHGGSEHD